MLKKAIILSLALVSVIGISSVLGQAKINAAVASVGYGGSSAPTSVSYCSSVVYGDWKPCANGWQYRDVLSQSPANCSLTAAQQSVRSMACGTTPVGAVTPTTPATPATPPAQVTSPAVPATPAPMYKFTRSLSMGLSGADVMALQKYLNAKGFLIAKSGAGSPGKETTKFGALTRQALINFQKANKISPAVGFFGPLTRAFVSSH